MLIIISKFVLFISMNSEIFFYNIFNMSGFCNCSFPFSFSYHFNSATLADFTLAISFALVSISVCLPQNYIFIRLFVLSSCSIRFYSTLHCSTVFTELFQFQEVLFIKFLSVSVFKCIAQFLFCDFQCGA